MKRKLILQTQRLFLKEITLNDAAFFLELVNTPGWLKYIGDENTLLYRNDLKKMTP